MSNVTLSSEQFGHIQRTLGQLETTLDILSESVERFRQESSNERERIRDNVAVMKEDVATLKREMKEIKPMVDGFNRVYLKAGGMMAAIAFMGGIAGWLFNLFASELRGILSRMF